MTITLTVLNAVSLLGYAVLHLTFLGNRPIQFQPGHAIVPAASTAYTATIALFGGNGACTAADETLSEGPVVVAGTRN